MYYMHSLVQQNQNAENGLRSHEWSSVSSGHPSRLSKAFPTSSVPATPIQPGVQDKTLIDVYYIPTIEEATYSSV